MGDRDFDDSMLMSFFQEAKDKRHCSDFEADKDPYLYYRLTEYAKKYNCAYEEAFIVASGGARPAEKASSRQSSGTQMPYRYSVRGDNTPKFEYEEVADTQQTALLVIIPLLGILSFIFCFPEPGRL